MGQTITTTIDPVMARAERAHFHDFRYNSSAEGKMPEFTDQNKNTLLLGYARNGRAGHVRTVLEAGANAAHTDEVHVCARSESGGMRVSGVHVWVCVCV